MEYSLYYTGDNALENVKIIGDPGLIFDSIMNLGPHINTYNKIKFKLFKSPLSVKKIIFIIGGTNSDVWFNSIVALFK